MSIVSMCQYLVFSYLSRDLEWFSGKRTGLLFGGNKDLDRKGRVSKNEKRVIINKVINTVTRFDLYLCSIMLKFLSKLKTPCRD